MIGYRNIDRTFYDILRNFTISYDIFLGYTGYAAHWNIRGIAFVNLGQFEVSLG